MNGKSFGFQRQQGAALVIGLILLLVLTILAVSGVFTSTMELRMVRNNQSQERSFQAAEVAIEDALANPVLSTSAPFNQATIAVPNSPGDTYSYGLQFVGQTPLGTGMTGYSIGCASRPTTSRWTPPATVLTTRSRTIRRASTSSARARETSAEIDT